MYGFFGPNPVPAGDTEAVEQLESAISNLDQAIIFKGGWDASSGSFPGGGTAQSGFKYIVEVSGTVDGIVFNIDDTILSIVDNASITTYASNWFKIENKALTDLTVTNRTNSQLEISNSSGSNVIIPQATNTFAGLLNSTEKEYLGNLTTNFIVNGSNLQNTYGNITARGFRGFWLGNYNQDISPDFNSGRFYKAESGSSTSTININNPVNGEQSNTFGDLLTFRLLTTTTGGCDFVFGSNYQDKNGDPIGTINLSEDESTVLQFHGDFNNPNVVKLLTTITKKADVGLDQVDNTSDVDKPISTTQQTALDGKIDKNPSITGSTKTKITYDSKGLVINGEDSTTADILDSIDKRYVTDSEKTVLSNTSGVNTGDQDLSGLLTRSNNLSDVDNRQSSLNNITNVGSAQPEYVLTKDTTTGNAIWKASQASGETTETVFQSVNFQTNYEQIIEKGIIE